MGERMKIRGYNQCPRSLPARRLNRWFCLQQGTLLNTPPTQPSFADFDDTFEFQDDVHGPILLNRLERDVVDIHFVPHAYSTLA